MINLGQQTRTSVAVLDRVGALWCVPLIARPVGESATLRLKQYVQGVSTPLVVLQNFPSVDSQAHAFIAARLQLQSCLFNR